MDQSYINSLIKKEIYKVAKEIKEIIRNDGDANINDLIEKEVEQHGYTQKERDFLRDCVRS